MNTINSTIAPDYNQNVSQTQPNAGATIYSPISMCLAGVLGNVLALVVLRRTKKESQRLMFHGLVGGLVWNDLIGILVTTPVILASYMNNLEMPGGEHLCKFNGFSMICFGISTPLIVCAMAIERYLFVKHTFFYTKHCPPSSARFVILVIWGFVLLFGLLPLFGFGKYVLQYPRTWCFLDLKATSPVDAAFSYLYALINLVLVIIMIMCNLVVVATLSRVRDYRRKQSTASLNMSLVMDTDDHCKMQSKRRQQKDIELQMICVMVAITTIYAICWVPLMIHIISTLSNNGVSNGLLGLIAIRLASINQTLNPWLYVILRRTLIIRVKKYCCKWRNERRKKTAHSGAPIGRRHQYVHVGNRLCHRNDFVGNDANSHTLSNSMRNSLQKAIPAAMSLPDVMMVNTGRRELELPLPDVAKAQSFGGRVSHDTSNYEIRCCFYDCPSNTCECSQCAGEHTFGIVNHNSIKNMDLDPKVTDNHNVLLQSEDAVLLSPNVDNNNRLNEALSHPHHHYSADSASHVEVAQGRICETDKLSAKPPSGRKEPSQCRDFQSSLKNSSSSRERHRTESHKSNDLDVFSSMVPGNRSSLHSQAGNSNPKGAMTQHIHMQRRDPRLSSSTKSHSDDSTRQRREMLFSDECDGSEHEYGNVFLDEEALQTASSNSKNDNATDCLVFSSNPTESFCFSDTSTPYPNNGKKPFTCCNFDPHRCKASNDIQHTQTCQLSETNHRKRSKSYSNDRYDSNPVDLRPDGNRPDCVEEEVSSGVFSVDSPTKLREEIELKMALWESNNHPHIEESSNSRSHLKQMVRRIKSVT